MRVIAAGKLVTSTGAAWALCVGADFVNKARGVAKAATASAAA